MKLELVYCGILKLCCDGLKYKVSGKAGDDRSMDKIGVV